MNKYKLFDLIHELEKIYPGASIVVNSKLCSFTVLGEVCHEEGYGLVIFKGPKNILYQDCATELELIEFIQKHIARAHLTQAARSLKLPDKFTMGDLEKMWGKK